MKVFDLIDAEDEAGLRSLIAHEPEWARARDAHGVSALLRARYRHRPGLVDAVLSVDPPLDVFDAAAIGRLDLLEQLLGQEPSLVHARSGDGFSALHLAAFFGQPAAARLLLDRGADPGAVAANPTEVQPLHSAAAVGHKEIAHLLLEAGADVNARQHGGWVPLHAAARHGDVEMIELLLGFGADPTLASHDGRSAADLAAEGGHVELATRLRPVPRT